MLKGKSLSEIWKLIMWAVRLDLRTAEVMEIATANRVLIEAGLGLLIIFSMLFMLFFKVV